MTKYTFRTIVAPDAVRADFTHLRNQLKSSDKELMQAFWNIGIDRLDDLKREVEMLQAATATARIEKKEMKAAAKRKDKVEKKPKAEKVVAKKAPKKAKKVDEVTKVIDHDDDDFQTVVVDGTV